jgi:two-component system chemotaxis response regulator CheB
MAYLSPASPPPRHLPRRPPRQPPRAVVIGASTGGPQALNVVLEGLAPILPHVPVFVTLHIPPEFIEVVARHAERLAGVPAAAAGEFEEVREGRIYFAPGDRHLGLARKGHGPVLFHSDGPPENFCKPSVDFLFRSAAHFYGEGLVAIILTGMGKDGLAGSQVVSQAGGLVIAQDAATSVVWGMPGSVASAGLAHAVLPLTEIAPAVCDLMRARRDVRAQR